MKPFLMIPLNSNQNNKIINTSKNNISKIKIQLTENKLVYIKNISIKGTNSI